MCGIAGRINYDGRPVRHADALRMVASLRHRGPDQQGLWFRDRAAGIVRNVPGLPADGPDFGDCFLGHSRLAIIDLETGSQPMNDLSGELAISYNGEIYNYLELRAELQRHGCRFRTTSDTEVILNAYRVHGPACVRHFNGMFAFALYDSRNDSLFCARDRLGIKPFYYYHTPRFFTFASEIKALSGLPEFDGKLDYCALTDYLTYLYPTENRTFFEDIKALPSGYTLTVSRGKILLSRYWQPDLEPDYTVTEPQAVEQLRSLVEDAVRLQLRSDVQLGAHLSGGVDSSAIASIASQTHGSNLFTFTGRFAEGALYDELPYARSVAEQIRARMFVTTPTADDLLATWPALVASLDHPTVGPGAFPQYQVARLAGSQLKVVLGGQGGDELFLGYPRHLRSLIEHRIIGGHADRSIAGASLTDLTAHYLSTYGLAGLGGWVLKRRRLDFAHRYATTCANLYGLAQHFSGELARTARHYSPVENAASRLDAIESTSLVNRMAWFDLTGYLEALLQVEDRTSMAWSLESRVPLLDHRIVEFGLKIPGEIKLKGLKPKYIFARAVEHVLPQAIRNRTDKRGFPTPVNLWFRQALAGYVRSFTTPAALGRRGLFDVRTLQSLLHGDRELLHDGLRRSTLLWSLISLEHWFRSFIDNSQPARPEAFAPDLNAIARPGVTNPTGSLACRS